MATFASLIVEVGAKIEKLSKGLADATSKIASFAKDAASKLYDIGKWVVGGIGVAIGAITYMILSTTTKIAALDDEAKRFGLPVDELQRFQYAAKLAGVEADSLGQAFQFMLKNVAEAGADPAGPAAASFRKLGLSADALSKLNTADQFTKIGEAFGKIANQGQKVQIAMDIFGRSGAQILNVFADNMKAAKKEFDELGLALTDFQVEGVAKFDDTRDRLGAVWEGFKEQVTAAVAPAFEFIYSYIIETVKKFGGIRVAALEMGMAIVDALIFAAEGMGRFIRSVVDGAQKAILAFDKIALTILKIAKNPLITPKEIDDPNDKRKIWQLGFGGRNKIANPDYEDITKNIDALEKDRAKREEILSKDSGKTAGEAWLDGLADGLKGKRSELDQLKEDIIAGKNLNSKIKAGGNALGLGASNALVADNKTGASKIDSQLSDRELWQKDQSAYYDRKFGELDQTIAEMTALRQKFPGTPFGTTGQNLPSLAAQKQTNVKIEVSYELGGDPIMNQILGSLQFKTAVEDTANFNLMSVTRSDRS